MFETRTKANNETLDVGGRRLRSLVQFGCLKDKTKVISADLLDFDFDFEDIIVFCNISVFVTFQFW